MKKYKCVYAEYNKGDINIEDWKKSKKKSHKGKTSIFRFWGWFLLKPKGNDYTVIKYIKEEE